MLYFHTLFIRDSGWFSDTLCRTESLVFRLFAAGLPEVFLPPFLWGPLFYPLAVSHYHATVF